MSGILKSRLIHYKAISWDSKDHPDGLASLVVGSGCDYGCPNCINRVWQMVCSKNVRVGPFVEWILENTVNDKIVLGGLEWTEQEDELYILLDTCEEYNANVILYTHWSEEEIKQKFPRLLQYDMYIKFGEYRPELASNDYSSHGIPLASTNQYIKRVGPNAPSGNQNN